MRATRNGHLPLLDDEIATAGRSEAKKAPIALLVCEAKRREAVEEAGFEVVLSESPDEAFELFERISPRVVVVGIGAAEDDERRCLAFIRMVRESGGGSTTPIVVTTRRRDPRTPELAYAAGATDVWLQGAGSAVWKKRLPFVVAAARAFHEVSRTSQKLERAKRVARFATWEWDVDTNCATWSEELLDVLGRDEPPAGGGVDAVLEVVHPLDRARVRQRLAEAVKDRRPFRFDHRALREDGVELVLHHEGEVVESAANGSIVLEAVVVDVTELKRAELQIHSLANYDRITGLLNRLSFLDLLGHARARSERRGGSLAVALVDIDRFKEVNESLGHAAGDRLLKEIAGRLLGTIRKGDCVAREDSGPLDTVARNGGDEFLLMLTDIDEAHHAARAARRMLDGLRRPFRLEERDIYLTGSMGIALVPPTGSVSNDELLRQAEIAMYSAKEQGRNTFQFFDESMNASVLRRFDIENGLRGAIARDELVLHYQPLVNARTRVVVGVEALLRWHHPVHGQLSADEFVPIAEESGLIIPIGRWVLRTACRALGSWRRQGLSSLRLSVNLSPRELRAPGFVACLAKVLEETETPPDQLELELTERGVVGNDPGTLDVLLRLKEIGVRLAVDDFGTGNTTFHYLKDFPLTTIKIDKSFTRGIIGNTKDAAITKALLAMAHRLQLNVVAEGVENEAQMSFLDENECDEVQGFLFGKAIPFTSLAELLENRTASSRS